MTLTYTRSTGGTLRTSSISLCTSILGPGERSMTAAVRMAERIIARLVEDLNPYLEDSARLGVGSNSLACYMYFLSDGPPASPSEASASIKKAGQDAIVRPIEGAGIALPAVISKIGPWSFIPLPRNLRARLSVQDGLEIIQSTIARRLGPNWPVRTAQVRTVSVGSNVSVQFQGFPEIRFRTVPVGVATK